ncbi:MAG: outer membrane beta-barrel protein [Pseudomonadota bacterium]
MKKLILAVMAGALAQPLQANTYNGGGFGLGEACSTKYQPSFFNGDCQKTGVVLRGLGGYRFNDYFSAEISAEGLISPWKLFGLDDVETESVSAFTVGGHTFLNLPITRRSRLFLGPSVGASIVYTSWDSTNRYNNTSQQYETTSGEDYDFSWNYGWAAGVEFFTQADEVIRLQWQNWRALNSKIAFGGEVNANYLTINFISRF